MAPTYEEIIESKIFKFIVGSRKKEYHVHAAAISQLSKPLGVLLDGPHKEAQELCVDWPDVDEKTFVRFAQWAYTKTYVTEEPEIVLGQYDIPALDDSGAIKTPASTGAKDDLETTKETQSVEGPLYSLLSAMKGAHPDTESCGNVGCTYYGQNDYYKTGSATCLVCRASYDTKKCAECTSAFSGCPKGTSCTAAQKNNCSNQNCGYYGSRASYSYQSYNQSLSCPRCLNSFDFTTCQYCASAFTGCPGCRSRQEKSLRSNLMVKFLNKDGTTCPPSTSAFVPRKNTEGCEDYTGVFMCHAKLYVLGDTYDIPQLRHLSLYRLHATLKSFTLYPSRFNDVATVAQYIFENTRPDDQIRDMITLYYACIVEDASKHDGLKSLIDAIPDFAFGLITSMMGRLS